MEKCANICNKRVLEGERGIRGEQVAQLRHDDEIKAIEQGFVKAISVLPGMEDDATAGASNDMEENTSSRLSGRSSPASEAE